MKDERDVSVILRPTEWRSVLNSLRANGLPALAELIEEQIMAQPQYRETLS